MASQLGLFLDGVGFFAGFIQDLLAQGLQGFLVGVHDVFAIEKTGGEAGGYGQTFHQKMRQYIHVIPLCLYLNWAAWPAMGSGRPDTGVAMLGDDAGRTCGWGAALGAAGKGDRAETSGRRG